jgi:predicted nucleotidyltransferase
MPIRIPFDLVKIEDFCRRWNVAEFALFGSVVGEDFGDASDVDVLVTFAPDARVGLITLSKMERELSAIFAREVDLVTKGGLKPLIRDEVLSQAEVLYAA